MWLQATSARRQLSSTLLVVVFCSHMTATSQGRPSVESATSVTSQSCERLRPLPVHNRCFHSDHGAGVSPEVWL